MKIKVLVLAVLMVVVPMAARGQMPEGMQQFLDGVNAALPMSAGNGMDFVRVGYDHSELVLFLEFDDDDQGLVVSMLDEKVLKDFILTEFKERMDMSIMDMLDTYDIDLGVSIRGRRSKKSTRVTFSANELSKAVQAPAAKPKSDLMKAIDLMKAMMPVKISEQMSLVRVDVADSAVFYVYEIDDRAISIGILKQKVSDLRETAKKQVKSNASSAAFVAQCKQEGMGLGFRYEGKTTGETFEFVIPTDEL
ncbi:MAG: hypothetical protein IJ745_03325 [Bacteroidales bacterium]|nr:hypothetical protein [Bacteroidales bacterium]